MDIGKTKRILIGYKQFLVCSQFRGPVLFTVANEAFMAATEIETRFQLTRLRGGERGQVEVENLSGFGALWEHNFNLDTQNTESDSL